MGLDHVKRWTDLAKRVPWSKAISVFFSSQSFVLDTSSPDPGRIVENPGRASIDDAVQRCLAEATFDQHVHVHHECWPQNPLNVVRLSNLLGLLMRRRADLRVRPAGWAAFIHGCWSLNASDLSVCDIDDEIRALLWHKVIADFSFPPGRAHCAPTVSAPHTVKPVRANKGYILPDAGASIIGKSIDAKLPTAADLLLSGEGDDGRFLIWNSPSPFHLVSLDVLAMSDPGSNSVEEAITSWIRDSPIIGSTLCIKTHAHSLWSEHWKMPNQPQTPVASPVVLAVFDRLSRTCQTAGVPLVYQDVSALLGDSHVGS